MKEPVFRIGFWVLLGGLLATRTYLTRQARPPASAGRPDRGAIAREGGGLFTARTAALLFAMVLLVLHAYDSPWLRLLAIPLPAILRWAGLGLGVVSLALWTWTHASLGREWSPQLQLRAEHRLVTTGPYRWVRHPMYTALFGVVVTLALLAANWAFVLLAAAVIGGLVLRAPREEAMMRQAFGEGYAAYCRATGRFFPRLGTPAATIET